MESVSVNITGAGDHVIIPAEARTWISVARVLLTCSVPDGGTMGISGKSDGEVRLGPFYMQNRHGCRWGGSGHYEEHRELPRPLHLQPTKH